MIRSLLAELFPSADITVVPDFAGAYLASPAGTDMCVVAGTGSAVVSPRPGGGWALSGGRGWILGDDGSAADLGRALLSWWVREPATLPSWVSDQVCRTYQITSWRSLTRHLQTSPTPARDLALSAPVLTRLAENGDEQALQLLAEAESRLAQEAARHINSYLDGRPHVEVSLVGGVWGSAAARDLFRAQLTTATAGRTHVAVNVVDPLAGMLNWAQSTA